MRGADGANLVSVLVPPRLAADRIEGAKTIVQGVAHVLHPRSAFGVSGASTRAQ